MADYKLMANGYVFRVADAAVLPDAPGNRDWDAYQAWVANGGAPDPYVTLPVDLVAYAADKRWQKEVGGITITGMAVPTDDRAKLLILGAAQTLAGDATAPFVVAGVRYGSFTGVQFKALNAAVVAHVQGTFVTLDSVLSGIDAATITTTAQVDAAFA